MKHLMLLSLLLFVSCSNPSQDKIIGEWKGTDKGGKVASLVFEKGGKAKLLMGNLVIEGGIVKDTAVTITWRLDDTQNPMHLDIIGTRGPNTFILPMIARFVTDTKLQVRMSKDMKTRPTEFALEEDNDQLVLIKE